MPTQIVLKEKQQEDGFLTCLKTHQKRKAGQREVCDLSCSHIFGLKNMKWVLGGYQLECFLHKSSCSALHPPPTIRRTSWSSTRAYNQSVHGSHREASLTLLWLRVCLPLLLFKYFLFHPWLLGNKLALQKSFRTFLWHMTNSPTLIHGRWRYYQWALVPFPTELGQETGAGWAWGAPGFPGVYH